jgi:hypothetical protein
MLLGVEPARVMPRTLGRVLQRELSNRFLRPSRPWTHRRVIEIDKPIHNRKFRADMRVLGGRLGGDIWHDKSDRLAHLAHTAARTSSVRSIDARCDCQHDIRIQTDFQPYSSCRVSHAYFLLLAANAVHPRNYPLLGSLKYL